jgi:heptosyltransferase-1
MRVLLVKTSSMGDVIHTLPALTDAGRNIPGIRFDWLVEEAFVEIPRWHPLVDQVIPVSLRRWRKGMLSRDTWASWRRLRQQLQANQYDLILDAQGLVKSAFLTLWSKGLRVGLDWPSERESLASLAYQKKCTVNFYQHAIVRMRELFSKALGYTLPDTQPDFGIARQSFQTGAAEEPYLVFLHGTTWTSKQWPVTYWITLADLAAKEGLRVKISGGNEEEVQRAKHIAERCSNVDVMPYLKIVQMAALLANSKGAVAVDTGFGHLAAAMTVPTVSIYGSTNPAYTGALGPNSLHLATQFACSPCLARDCTYREAAEVTPACYATIPPALVWQTLKSVFS